MHRDIREMNAKSHPERFVGRPIGARQLDADLYGASQSVNRARKLRKRRIAGPVEDPAVERSDFFRDERFACGEPRNCPFFRLLHYGGKADDVANHDRGHPTLHRRAFPKTLSRRLSRSHFVLCAGCQQVEMALLLSYGRFAVLQRSSAKAASRPSRCSVLAWVDACFGR